MESRWTSKEQVTGRKRKLSHGEQMISQQLEADALAWQQVNDNLGWRHLAITHQADSCHGASSEQHVVSADPVAPQVHLVEDSCSTTEDDSAPLIQEAVPRTQPAVVPRLPDAASAVPEPRTCVDHQTTGLDLEVISDDDCAQPDSSITIIAEVFSPPRITAQARKHGLQPGLAFDLTSGTDLGTVEGRAQVWTYLKQSRPGLVVLSPPCTYFSTLMNLNKGKMGDKYASGLAHARSLLEFAAKICMLIMIMAMMTMRTRMMEVTLTMV